MEEVIDILWEKDTKVKDLVQKLGSVGFQSVRLGRASEIMAKMKRDSAKIFLTFTSNMVTSGLRGFFAQLIKLKMADVIITTVGGIEEDIMKAKGDKFLVTTFYSDDIALHEKGMNRIGNLLISNDSYMKFEYEITKILEKIFEKKKRLSVSELLHEIGLTLDDENSILYQAAKNNIPIFCPAITDGAFGFHLFMLQQDHPEFIVDVVKDFYNILNTTSYDEKKGIIALGGGVSKHHAILAGMINGGMDYAVYMTTAHETSGSVGGATTNEAKSWGKIKDSSDAVTVNGDVSILFPLAMMKTLDTLSEEGLI